MATILLLCAYCALTLALRTAAGSMALLERGPIATPPPYPVPPAAVGPIGPTWPPPPEDGERPMLASPLAGW